MIACVDADYDFLMQGATPTSEMVCRSPYVLHTGVYAIENLQCHAETLAHVCVMATLNDLEVMDYEAFFAEFSEIIFPLLVWNVWAYRYGLYTQFSLSDFARVVELRFVNIYHPEEMLQALKPTRESANQPPATDVSRRQTNLCSPARTTIAVGCDTANGLSLHARARLAGWSGDALDDEHL